MSNNNNSKTMKVELSIHALKLKNVAGAFKGTSDPFAVLTLLATEPGKTPTVLGKTEVVSNTLSPQWVKVFVIDYALGTPCKVAINVFDQVRKGDNKSMGSAVFDVNEVLGARGNIKCKKIKNGTCVACVCQYVNRFCSVFLMAVPTILLFQVEPFSVPSARLRVRD